MIKNDNIIVAQCCFKGAIDLAVANKITVEEVFTLTQRWTDDIIKSYGNDSKTTVVKSDGKPSFQPKDNYKKTTNGKSPTVKNPDAPVSEKQLWLLNKLVGELPADQQNGFTGLIKDNMKMGLASSLIEEMKTIIDGQKPEAKPMEQVKKDSDGAPTEAPF
ncbi:MAG: hypothetical protein Unbinned6224contig1003_22 [Prokaryotic dsDNA virus sp.]|nr:MAG: hypothetical protein Unbinned6224contig1003_22 [Prokaryotic dsDNA virus sp.]|tara:strand:- start:213 stop:695 length:483 start_codon:yes stop_codon:yes gene_type:complete